MSAVLGVGALLASGVAAAGPATAQDLPANADQRTAVKDDRSPMRPDRSVGQLAPRGQSWSDPARREFHAPPPAEERAGSAPTAAEPRAWTGAELRELKGSKPR